MNTEPNITEAGDLTKLREREMKLESQIADENVELGIRTKNIISLTHQLSDCKRAIAQLTLVKLNAQ